MTNKPTIRIHNIETNEIVDRRMNDIEYAQYQTDQAATAAALIEMQTKTVARQAVLARLGLTEEEAQLIIGGSN
jgi:hypothetical protein